MAKDLGLIVKACNDVGKATVAAHLVCTQFDKVQQTFNGETAERQLVQLEADATGVLPPLQGGGVPHQEK